MKKDILIFGVLVLVAVVSRLIPHGWNFTAMGATALVAGFLIERKVLSFAVPLVSLLISDLFLQSHNTVVFVGLGYILMTAVGYLFKDGLSTKSILSSALLGSLCFFFVSNFGVWYEGVLYPSTFEGFKQCYLMAVPFFKNELVSNLVLSPALLYVTKLLSTRVQFA